jgi:hypothetical protein
MSNQSDFEYYRKNMSKASFDNNYPVKHKTDEILNECCICLEEMEPNCFRTKCCLQNMHKECLKKWCTKSFDNEEFDNTELSICPLCNNKFNSKYLFSPSLCTKFLNLLDNCCDGSRK